jgi:hypothetical protein
MAMNPARRAYVEDAEQEVSATLHLTALVQTQAQRDVHIARTSGSRDSPRPHKSNDMRGHEGQ